MLVSPGRGYRWRQHDDQRTPRAVSPACRWWSSIRATRPGLTPARSPGACRTETTKTQRVRSPGRGPAPRTLGRPGPGHRRRLVGRQTYETTIPLAPFIEAADRLTGLTALFLGEMTCEENEISWIQQGDVTPLLRAFPRLEVLRVRGGEGLELQPGTLPGPARAGLRVGRAAGRGRPRGRRVRPAGAAPSRALARHRQLRRRRDRRRPGHDPDRRAPARRWPTSGCATPRSPTRSPRRSPARRWWPGCRRSTCRWACCPTSGAAALLAGQPLTHLRQLDLHHHFLTDADDAAAARRTRAGRRGARPLRPRSPTATRTTATSRWRSRPLHAARPSSAIRTTAGSRCSRRGPGGRTAPTRRGRLARCRRGRPGRLRAGESWYGSSRRARTPRSTGCCAGRAEPAGTARSSGSPTGTAVRSAPAALAAAVAAAGARLLNDPDEILALFDKRALPRPSGRGRGPVPAGAAGPGAGYAELRAAMADAGWSPGVRQAGPRLVRLGRAGAAGPRPSRVRATTSVERGRTAACSIRCGCASTRTSGHRLHCGHSGPGRAARRAVVPQGRAGRPDRRPAGRGDRRPGQHVVVRGSRGPDDQPAPRQRARRPRRAARGGRRRATTAALDTCERAAACFPGSLQVGVDLMFSPDWRRHAVAEVNAFGDLLPGLLVGRSGHLRRPGGRAAMGCRTRSPAMAA